MSQWNVSVFLYRISHFYLWSHPDPSSLTCVPIPCLPLLLKMQLIPCKHNGRALTSHPCSVFSAPTLGFPIETGRIWQVDPESAWKLKGADAHRVNVWPMGPRSWWMPFPPSFFWMDCSGYPVMASMTPHPHVLSDLHHCLTTFSVIHASQLD